MKTNASIAQPICHQNAGIEIGSIENATEKLAEGKVGTEIDQIKTEIMDVNVIEIETVNTITIVFAIEIALLKLPAVKNPQQPI